MLVLLDTMSMGLSLWWHWAGHSRHWLALGGGWEGEDRNAYCSFPMHSVQAKDKWFAGVHCTEDLSYAMATYSDITIWRFRSQKLTACLWTVCLSSWKNAEHGGHAGRSMMPGGEQEGNHPNLWCCEHAGLRVPRQASWQVCLIPQSL